MRTIFISLDTVCARRISAVAPFQVPTPNISSLADESALFTSAFASDIPTQPSHTAVFTGRYGLSTGIVSHFHPPARLSTDYSWLPSVFQSRGYRTAAVDHMFSMKEWFVRGYDDYISPPGRSRSPGSVINQLGCDWLKRQTQEDYFLFLHYWDAHIPYLPPEPYKSAFTARSAQRIDPFVQHKLRSRPSYPLFKQNLYDHLDQIPNLDYIEDLHYAELAYLDAELGRLFNFLDDEGILDDSMIVLFGDHGEVMTEHDAWFDHAGLYDSVVHVPLMIRAPGRVRPARIDALVSLVDLFPTIIELNGFGPLPDDEPIDGRSLVPLIEGRVSDHREELFLSECTWQAKRAVRTKSWKYIRCWHPGIYERSEPELYDLTADPLEQCNLASLRPDVAEHLDARLGQFVSDRLGGRPDPMDEVVEYGLPAVARLQTVIDEEGGSERISKGPERVGPTERSIVDLTDTARPVVNVMAG